MRTLVLALVFLLSLVPLSLVSAEPNPPPTDVYFGWIRCDAGAGDTSVDSTGASSSYASVEHSGLPHFYAETGTWLAVSAYCTPLADPGYIHPTGNVSEWQTNNQHHSIYCGASITGQKFKIVDDTNNTYTKYEVWTDGGNWLGDLARGDAPYPNGVRKNTLRWNTNRCSGT